MDVVSVPTATPAIHAPSLLAWTLAVAPNWSHLFIHLFNRYYLVGHHVPGLTRQPWPPTMQVPQ